MGCARIRLKVTRPPMTDFTRLGLAAPILKALTAEGYETPTPIQLQAIPHVMEGADLLGVAQTGTGKTAAFALPILHRLATDRISPGARACRVLVLSPTRELASQIADSFKTYGRFMGLGVQVVFGGVPIRKQMNLLSRGTDVLVATPGRLLDLVDQRALTLNKVETLVLDEADQMLDLGFVHALKRIVTLVPEQRQTLFFSATMPPAIATLAAQYLTDPVKVSVTPAATTVERINQSVIHVENSRKSDLLIKLLADPELSRVLVFSRTKHGADRIARKLIEANIPSDAIHGNKSQPQRIKALDAFKSGRARVLVATDVAARGIDVDGVSHVLNYDLPNVPESYVHRIGRTARAGADGIAISFCDREERAYLRDIEKVTRQQVPVMIHPMSLPTPSADERVSKPPNRARNQNQGFSGGQGRPSGQQQGRARPPQGRPGGNGGGQGRPGGGNGPRQRARPAPRTDARFG